MASSTTTKRSSGRRKTAAENTAVEIKEMTAEEFGMNPPEVDEAEVVAELPKKKIVARDIDPNQYVTVRNGYHGSLIYKSPRTNERFVWDSFGDEQEMELRELKNAKNSKKGFFINNWFMFDEDWIVDYLGVRNFYKHAIGIDDFDSIFSLNAKEIKDVVGKMSVGQKKSAAYRAKQLINEQQIDSLSVITALEDALGIGLIER